MASKNMDTLTAETAQALTKERKDVAFVIAYTHEPEGMSPPDHATPYHGEREVDTAKGWPEAQTLFRGIALDNKTLHAELKLVIRSLHGPTINEAYVPYPCTTVSLATYRRGDPLPTVGDMAVDITWFDNTEETEMSWNEKGPECVTKGLAFFALKSRDPTVRKARCMLLLTHGGRQETLPLAGFDAEWTRMIGADTLESLGSLKRPRDSKEEEEDDWAEQPLVKRPCRRQAPLWNPDQEPEEIHVYGTQLMAVYGGDKKICNDIVLHMNAKSRGQYYADWNRSTGHVCFSALGNVPEAHLHLAEERPTDVSWENFLNPGRAEMLRDAGLPDMTVPRLFQITMP